jgi:hypothetical protein
MVIIKKFILDFINSDDSQKNSKLIIALAMSVVFTASCLMVLIGVPPADSIHISTLLWAQATVILGALGVNGIENIRKK